MEYEIPVLEKAVEGYSAKIDEGIVKTRSTISGLEKDIKGMFVGASDEMQALLKENGLPLGAVIVNYDHEFLGSTYNESCLSFCINCLGGLGIRRTVEDMVEGYKESFHARVRDGKRDLTQARRALEDFIHTAIELTVIDTLMEAEKSNYGYLLFLGKEGVYLSSLVCIPNALGKITYFGKVDIEPELLEKLSPVSFRKRMAGKTANIYAARNPCKSLTDLTLQKHASISALGIISGKGGPFRIKDTFSITPDELVAMIAGKERCKEPIQS